MSPRVTEMYAFVVSDSEPDDEGVIGMQTLTGWRPFVGADMARIDQLRPIAQALADQMGKEVRLLHFAGPPVVAERFTPEPRT